MSNQRLPDNIAPFKLARQRRTLQGSIPASKMPRLMEYLATERGAVEFDLEFGIDEFGVSYGRGSLEADLDMQCQRCMEPMAVAVKADIAVGFVGSDAQAKNLAGSYEPCLVEDEEIELSALIEDELILALPIVSLHPDESCQPWLEQKREEQVKDEQGEEKKNPFAILAELKK